MTLPRPPISHSTPIPNQPFEAAEVYYLESNYGPLPLGGGLYIDPYSGELSDTNPSSEVDEDANFGSSKLSILGKGKEIDFPVNPKPLQEFTDPASGAVYKWGRTRWQDGTFRADIPETERDEAWAWLLIGTHTDNTGEAK